MEQKWEMYKSQADKALQQGKHDHAESFLYAALGVAEDFENNDPRLTVTLEALSELLFRTAQYHKAEPVLVKTLEIYEETLGENHPDVGILSNNLAMLYHLQDKFEDAERLYKKAMFIQTKTLGAKHPEVINLLGNYAQLLFRMHRFEEAEHMRACATSAQTGRWNRSGRYQAFQKSSTRVGGEPEQPPAPVAQLQQSGQYQAVVRTVAPPAAPPQQPVPQPAGAVPAQQQPAGGKVVPPDDEFRVSPESSPISKLLRQRKQD